MSERISRPAPRADRYARGGLQEEGAAEALRDLARARRNDLPALRALDQAEGRDG